MIWMRWFRDSPDVLLVTYCPTPPRTPMGMLWNNLKESADILWWSSPCGKDWTRKYFCVFWLYLMPCYRSSQSWLCMQDMKWQIELIWIAQVLPKQSCYLWERQVVLFMGALTLSSTVCQTELGFGIHAQRLPARFYGGHARLGHLLGWVFKHKCN